MSKIIKIIDERETQTNKQTNKQIMTEKNNERQKL